jgi:hypothetical protein
MYALTEEQEQAVAMVRRMRRVARPWKRSTIGSRVQWEMR